MTPKEKAIELIDKFKIGDVVTEKLQIVNINIYSKLFALIAVDELIRIAPWGSDIDGEIEDDSKEYYIEVKQEIENYKQ